MARRIFLPFPWLPPPFRPSTSSRRRIPRGSGADDGGPPDLIGRITVLVSQRGALVAGRPVRFTAVRTGGSAPLTYQWSGPSGPIPGATGSAYTFTPAGPGDSGTYTVAVTSAGATDGPQTAGAAVTVVAANLIITVAGDHIITDAGDRISWA